jgi:hypothetical protein
MADLIGPISYVQWQTMFDAAVPRDAAALEIGLPAPDWRYKAELGRMAAYRVR